MTLYAIRRSIGIRPDSARDAGSIRQCSLSRANDADASDDSRAGRMRRRGSGRSNTTWMASLILAQDKRWRRA